MLLSGEKRGDVLRREVWVLFSGHCVRCVGELNTEEERGAGLSVEDALERFDAYPLLARLDDAIVTGPTGNNVRDIRILIAER